MNGANAELRDIPVRLIDRNPENPRTVFRAAELDLLLESIREYGVQVPISVYKDGRRYVLIDGERRWQCSVKLNKETIPALVQAKPAPLANLLLMFNIHALREQWDLLTIALKLPRIIALLAKELGAAPNERQLSAKTGLSVGLIRRCKLLMDLPEEHKDALLLELKKPKAKQRITEDFYIEMERALRTVERAMPAIISDKEQVRRVLIDKYVSGTIPNIVQFRQVAKIARADRVAADPEAAKYALTRLFAENNYGIEAAYNDSVSLAYNERDLLTRLESLTQRLNALSPNDLDDAIRERLDDLATTIARLLGPAS